MNRFSLLLIAAALVGCPQSEPTPDGMGPMASGRITDAGGAQARFAGQGTLSASTKVQSHTIAADGTLTFFADADIADDGTYTVELPDSSAEFFVVTAIDASGDAIGSVVVEPAEGDRAVTPLDTESSVEALVFLESDANVDLWAFVRARVDAETAASVMAASDGDAAIVSLSDAVRASAAAEVESWTQAGVNVSQALDARLAASKMLSTALDAETAGAYDAFLVAMGDAETAAGATPENQAKAEASASLAFRATLRAEGATDLLNASAKATTSAEARAWDSAIETYLMAAGASQATLDEASQVNAQLQADLDASASASATARAVADWRTDVVGATAVEGSLLGDALVADILVEAALDAAVEAALDASLTLETTVQASADAAVAAPTFDAEAFGEATAQAMQDYRTSVDADVMTALSIVTDASASASLIIAAEGAFRGL